MCMMCQGLYGGRKKKCDGIASLGNKQISNFVNRVSVGYIVQ